MLEENRQNFRTTFGRSEGPKDRVFFGNFVLGANEHWQVVKKAAEQAGVPDELIFASCRTGLVVTEQNARRMPEVDLDEWSEEIRQFREMRDAGVDPWHRFTYLDPPAYEQYKSCLKLIEQVIVVGFSAVDRRPKIRKAEHLFQCLMLCSALNSYRTINEMFRSRYDDDCLAILRGIYEQYLRIKMLRLQPESVSRFEGAMYASVGLWPYRRRSDGSVDYTTVMPPGGGKGIKVTVQNYSIAQVSDFAMEQEIYQELYFQLSGHVHHDVTLWALSGIAAGRLEMDREQDSVRAIALILFVSVLLLSEAAKCEWLLKVSRRDLTFTARRLAIDLRRLVGFGSVQEHAALPPCVAKGADALLAELSMAQLRMRRRSHAT